VTKSIRFGGLINGKTMSVQDSGSRRFSSKTKEVLEQAGWHEGRVVDDAQLEEWCALKWNYAPGYCQIFPVALQVLREFGGLVINQHGPGITCARTPFFIDPVKALGIEDDNWFIDEWLWGMPLYLLGAKGERMPPEDVLAIDPIGRVLGLTYGHILYGKTFDEALENMILGFMPERLGLEVHAHRKKEGFQVRNFIYKTVFPDWSD
jgi:hypothetical protein